MSTDDYSDVMWVPVDKVEVNISLEEVLASLAQEGQNLSHAAASGNVDPQLGDHGQKLSDLASQLRDVVSNINRIHPAFLQTEIEQQQPPPTSSAT